MELGSTVRCTNHNHSRFQVNLNFLYRHRETFGRTDPPVRDPEGGVVHHNQTPVSTCPQVVITYEHALVCRLHHCDRVEEFFEDSLKALGLDYVDLVSSPSPHACLVADPRPVSYPQSRRLGRQECDCASSQFFGLFGSPLRRRSCRRRVPPARWKDAALRYDREQNVVKDGRPPQDGQGQGHRSEQLLHQDVSHLPSLV